MPHSNATVTSEFQHVEVMKKLLAIFGTRATAPVSVTERDPLGGQVLAKAGQLLQLSVKQAQGQ